MKTLKNITKITLAAALLLLISITCSKPSDQQITILHTNDFHGAFLPSKATWIKHKPKPMIGGFLALAHYLKQVRSQTSNTLLLDAGDIMTGNEICNIEFKGAKGGALIDMMNMLEFEGLTIGNHEFDISQDNIYKLIELSEFPVYSANIYKENGQLFAPAAYHIYNKQGLRIGVIGAILENLFDVLNYSKHEGLVVKPNAETIKKIVDEIDAQTDLIIILSHCGVDADSVLAENLDRRVDLIVGGHSHTRIYKPRKINNILVVQAGAKCRYLGKLDLTVVADTIQTYAGELIPLWVKGITKNESIEKQVNHFRKIIDDKFGRVIGQLKSDWQRAHYRESNIGNFLADCMREYTGTDFASINSGGIRKNLAAGEIKIIDIREILPFDNKIWTFEVTGKQLLQFMHHNANAAAFREHGILQTSGLITRWKKNPDGSIRFTKSLVNGKPVDPQKIYTGATVDFVLMANCEKYLGINVPKIKKEHDILFTEVVLRMVEQKEEINSSIERRLAEE